VQVLCARSGCKLRVNVPGASFDRLPGSNRRGPGFAWTTAGGKEPAEATYPPGPLVMLSWKEPTNSIRPLVCTRRAPDILEVRVSDARLRRSLLAFLGRTSYAAEARDDGVLVIDPPGALDPQVARAEVRVYLRTWERLTPGGAASLKGET
jgi:hypothetical protein